MAQTILPKATSRASPGGEHQDQEKQLPIKLDFRCLPIRCPLIRLGFQLRAPSSKYPSGTGPLFC